MELIEQFKDKFLRKEPDPEFAALIDNLVKLVNEDFYSLSMYRDGDFYLSSTGGTVEISGAAYPRPRFHIRMVTYKDEDTVFGQRLHSDFYATTGNKAVLKQLEYIFNDREAKTKAATPTKMLSALEKTASKRNVKNRN